MFLFPTVCVLFFILFITADALIFENVEFSVDGGSTWLQESSDISYSSLPASAKLRLRGGNSYILLPVCAVTKDPALIEWRGLNVLGVRDAALCVKRNENSFQLLYAEPIELVPTWHKYLHGTADSRKKRSMDDDVNTSETGENAQGEKGKKRRGFWSKYGFYIGAFICFSLIQGIREGNAQYKQEMEEAARAEAAKQAEASSKTNIVVPRRKNKNKKNATKKS